MPFIESQYGVRQEIHYCHVRELGVNAVWETVGVGKSALVRCSYYANMAISLNITQQTNLSRFGDLYLQESICGGMFDMFGWVHVPDPFDLAEFSRRLLLDFHSLDPHEMEARAVGIVQGQDPIHVGILG